jgi:vacuolar-type H+-ATPase subunit I/STV1
MEEKQVDNNERDCKDLMQELAQQAISEISRIRFERINGTDEAILISREIMEIANNFRRGYTCMHVKGYIKGYCYPAYVKIIEYALFIVLCEELSEDMFNKRRGGIITKIEKTTKRVIYALIKLEQRY